jgi:3-oxoacyl-[acyl-carrier protein] reductase
MELFAARGANVFACAYKPADDFEALAKDLSARHGVRVIPVYFDMADNGAVRAAAQEIQKAKLPVSALVNIAGVARDSLFHMVTMEQLMETFQVNFFSQIMFSQYMTKLMLRGGGGSVIFISSVTALEGNEGQLAYGASKAALIGAMKTMARELGPKGIRVNAVAPGLIDTAMTRAVPAEITARKIARTDLKRLGTAEEAAAVLLYLASDQSAYITGQTILVDGGIAS